MIQVYFDHIHLEIINLLKQADTEIKICVAWFTDKDIYHTLVKKAKEGVSVDVIVANHEFNKKKYGLNYNELLKYGGRVSFIGNVSSGKADRLMHNKFCIIDSQTIISGSYNWSIKARQNDENVLVITGDENLVQKFLNKFTSIQPQFGFKLGSRGVELVAIQEIMNKWQKPKKKKLKTPFQGDDIGTIIDKF